MMNKKKPTRDGCSRMGRWVRWVLCRWLDGASPASQPYLHGPGGENRQGKLLFQLNSTTAGYVILFPCTAVLVPKNNAVVTRLRERDK